MIDLGSAAGRLNSRHPNMPVKQTSITATLPDGQAKNEVPQQVETPFAPQV